MGSVVADSKDKIHLRRSWLGEFFPAFAAQSHYRKARGLQLRQRLRADKTSRMAPRTVGLEARSPFVPENAFGQDGAGRIPGTQKQNVVVVFHFTFALRLRW